MSIAFSQIPASIRKPGKYAEFNTELAVRTLPSNAQKVIFIAPMSESGTAMSYVPYDVFDSAMALNLFGDSDLYTMTVSAIKTNPYIRLTCMALPATNGVYQTAFTSVFGANYNIYVIGSNSQENLTALRNHLDAVSHAVEQRPAIGATAFTGTVSAGGVLASALNSGRIYTAWHKNSTHKVCDIAAAFAAEVAYEEDPARPLNTLPLTSITPNDIIDRPGRVEQEVALVSGLTPLEVGPGDKVQIVRAISTYTKNAAGADDISLLDITSIRSMDYVRKACIERINLRFPRSKKTKRVKEAVRGELLDVLYKLEELEIVENVDANKDKLIVEDNLQDPNRLDVVIPCDVVNGLHVFAARIDLYL